MLNIVGTKKNWFYVTVFIPLIFTIVTVIMVFSGVIGATFFPNIQPDFFTIEAAYNPGDSKEQTEITREWFKSSSTAKTKKHLSIR